MKISKKIAVRAGLPIATVMLAGISFYSGVDYQKHHISGSASATTASTLRESGGFGQSGSGGGFLGGGSRIIGQVTAISSSSITVQASDGSSKTLAISSSTQITNNGQTTQASDIQTGNTVFVTIDPSNTSQASRILLNPNFGGDSGASGSPVSGGSQSQNAPSGLQTN